MATLRGKTPAVTSFSGGSAPTPGSHRVKGYVMVQPHAFAPAFLAFGMLALATVPARADDGPAPAAGRATAAVKPDLPAKTSVPAPAPSAAKPPLTTAQAAAALRAARRPARPPGPLKHLSFSAREGFALRMVSDQDVSAEIRNGAGRTLAHKAYTLQAGDWTLRPKNLAPGLYTVLLRTGPNLRSLRMKIVDAERGEGQPEWVLEKAEADSTRLRNPGGDADPASPRGAFLSPEP